MRVTLLAAQRMAESIVQEAQEKAEEIKKQADDSAKAQIEEGRRELALTEQKLQEGKLALQKFIDEGKKLWRTVSGLPGPSANVCPGSRYKNRADRPD